MATGHILPGYGNPVTRLRRAKTAYPMDRQKLEEITARNIPDLDRRTLDSIRANARDTWLSTKKLPTTYNSVHNRLQLDEPTQSLPTELERRHKPHPQPVFLINRLHYVPGYHNPDNTMGKDVFRVDASVPEEERQFRLQQREKFIGRPRTPAIHQYKESPYAALTESAGPVEAWGAQAWLQVADDDHKHEVVNAIQNYREKELFKVDRPSERSPRPHTAIPSMHRWLRMAGAKESSEVRHILYGDYPPSTIQPLGNVGYPPTTQLRRKQDIDNVRRATYVHKSLRGDFLIHPEYPPTIPHHRID